ncbi:MAG: ribonuclease HIII [Candidatus Cloacimonetes bacterium]|nr:ribonuclease HIII [Candidatus Cloacimonadota bacterium]
MHPAIMKFLETLLPVAQRHGLQLSDEKEINYGVQVEFCSKEDSIPINIYYSQKKGLSTVIGGSPKNKLRPLLTRLLNKPYEPVEIDHEWQNWIGTDESGKGDFFGPLVVAGFYGERKILPFLQQIGVKDSKLLKDAEIEGIGKRLYGAYFEQIKTITLLPATYNRQYAEMKTRGKNLNDLLAWMHARTIVDLHSAYKPEGIMIDKFTTEGRIRGALQEMRNIPFTARIKGENDPLVAAASIVARFHLNRWFVKTSQELEMDIPRGAGAIVDKAAQVLAEKIGKKDMSNYVKTHFSNYNKIK